MVAEQDEEAAAADTAFAGRSNRSSHEQASAVFITTINSLAFERYSLSYPLQLPGSQETLALALRLLLVCR